MTVCIQERVDGSKARGTEGHRSAGVDLKLSLSLTEEGNSEGGGDGDRDRGLGERDPDAAYPVDDGVGELASPSNIAKESG